MGPVLLKTSENDSYNSPFSLDDLLTWLVPPTQHNNKSITTNLKSIKISSSLLRAKEKKKKLFDKFPLKFKRGLCFI